MKKWILLVVILGVSFSAWGASTKKNRDDSLIFVGITPIGVHIPTLLTRPIGLGVYLGDSWMIGAEAGAFDFEFDDGDTKADGTYENRGIYGRWFLGNSFNLGLAIHQRNFSADALTTVFDSTTSTDVRLDASLDANATVGSLIVGNQWIMDFGLVLALDWVVLSGLMSSSVDASLSGTFIDSDGNTGSIADLDPETIAQAQKDLEDLGEFVNQVSAFPGILVFTIGWAF